MTLAPDGLLLSNGPGDPEPVHYVIETVAPDRARSPSSASASGSRCSGLAMGGKTYKLKFGHHGGNHPVKDLDTGRIAITSQNHGFNVDMELHPGEGTRITHVNLYDGTAEGLENRDLRTLQRPVPPRGGAGAPRVRALFAALRRP